MDMEVIRLRDLADSIEHHYVTDELTHRVCRDLIGRIRERAAERRGTSKLPRETALIEKVDALLAVI